TLLSINFKETASTAKTFAEEAGVSFPVLLDTDGKIAAQFLVWPLPAIFVLDAKGIVHHKIIGATNVTALETKIIAVTRGGEIRFAAKEKNEAALEYFPDGTYVVDCQRSRRRTNAAAFGANYSFAECRGTHRSHGRGSQRPKTLHRRTW